MKAGKILAGVLFAIGVVAFLSVIIVKEVNQAIILQFGDPKRIIMKPGLNFKIPFIQNVVFLDKRILNLDTPPEEVIASDQKRLIVDAYARFKIIDPFLHKKCTKIFVNSNSNKESVIDVQVVTHPLTSQDLQ